jgi:hypothetical protein
MLSFRFCQVFAICLWSATFLSVCFFNHQPYMAQNTKWVGTWSAAPYAAGKNTPPAPYPRKQYLTTNRARVDRWQCGKVEGFRMVQVNLLLL